MDKPCSKVFINELTQSGKFLLGQGVYRTIGYMHEIHQATKYFIKFQQLAACIEWGDGALCR